MRGKLTQRFPYFVIHRITPADAGKTGEEKNDSRTTQDHPRGCGENFAVASVSPHFVGSPPRMRGKRYLHMFSPPSARITPADAGKTM